VIEYRWAENQTNRLNPLASELVGQRVSVIVATDGSQTTSNCAVVCSRYRQPPLVAQPVYNGIFYRLMARRDPVGIRLITRRGKDWTTRYPLVVEAVNCPPSASETRQKSVPENLPFSTLPICLMSGRGTRRETPIRVRMPRRASAEGAGAFFEETLSNKLREHQADGVSPRQELIAPEV
jgi:hypothetical protein